MYQYDDPTVTASLPASTGEGTPGYFTDGNPAGGQAATILRAEFMNMLMMEMVNAITGAGITPSKDTFTQLRSAIEAYITARVASSTYAGIVALSTNAQTQSGALSTVAVTPASLSSRTATETRTGLVELATVAETLAGTDATRAVPPSGLAATVFGLNQAWADVTASRALATTYTNSTGKPIAVNAFLQSNASNASPALTINGSLILYGSSQQNATYASAVFGIIPNGATYAINVSAGTGTLIKWSELR